MSSNEPSAVFGPASPKQSLFVNSSATITAFGGAAGGGKTFCALLTALRFLQHPRATGAFFRRTSVMLTAPGSAWSEACSMYSTIYPKGLRIKHRSTEIVFPNGAVLKFGHLQHEQDKEGHRGAQYSFIIMDEIVDFSEETVIFMLSRLRNAYVDYKPQFFMMGNPSFDSFLRIWLQDFYLDERGIPLPSKAGVMRYMKREGSSTIWYNSLKAAEAVHGDGPESGILSFTFIGANCTDNPPLLKAQPDYISNLKMQSRVDVERYLYGSWFARQESSGLFKREWVREVPYPNATARQRVRAWDLAFSQPSETYPNPDWTAGVLMSKDVSKIYTIEDVVTMRDRVHKVEELIFATAVRDGKGTTIAIPQDPNAAAGAYARDLQRRLAELGFHCRLLRPVQSKVTRFAPFSSIAQAGFVQVVIADWNKQVYEQLEIFNGDKKNKDDIVDACSDCIYLLNREMQLPSMTIPDLSSVSPPNFKFGASSAAVTLPSFNLR